MLKVGFVDYINTLPLSAAFRLNQIKTDAELTYAIPSTLNSLLSNEKLDMSLVSSVEYLDGDYTYLPYGIIAHKNILSVNLYIRDELSDGVIALTHHSATSISLLKLLCSQFWKIKPSFIPLDRTKELSEYPAFLLIGDEALEKRNIRGYRTIDLAQSWHKMTGLPFVFALFAVRKQSLERKKEEVETFHRELETSLSWAQKNSELVETLAQKMTPLPLKLIQQYYSLCKFHLGEREYEGLTTFASMRHE
ncbi:MAG: Chorismate dehydratase [Chlamydiae bacterium]|nr:Chorismate dehydratase [Chlamydiota bacterium]